MSLNKGSVVIPSQLRLTVILFLICSTTIAGFLFTYFQIQALKKASENCLCLHHSEDDGINGKAKAQHLSEPIHPGEVDTLSGGSDPSASDSVVMVFLDVSLLEELASTSERKKRGSSQYLSALAEIPIRIPVSSMVQICNSTQMVCKDKKGSKGERGLRGEQGRRGRPGPPGRNGTVGPPGLPGVNGTTCVNQTTANCQCLCPTLQSPEEGVQAGEKNYSEKLSSTTPTINTLVSKKSTVDNNQQIQGLSGTTFLPDITGFYVTDLATEEITQIVNTTPEIDDSNVDGVLDGQILDTTTAPLPPVKHDTSVSEASEIGSGDTATFGLQDEFKKNVPALKQTTDKNRTSVSENTGQQTSRPTSTQNDFESSEKSNDQQLRFPTSTVSSSATPDVGVAVIPSDQSQLEKDGDSGAPTGLPEPTVISGSKEITEHTTRSLKEGMEADDPKSFSVTTGPPVSKQGKEKKECPVTSECEKGEKGHKGKRGQKGDRGRIGHGGQKGEPGSIGPHGQPGPTGPAGQPGPIGPTGETGSCQCSSSEVFFQIRNITQIFDRRLEQVIDEIAEQKSLNIGSLDTEVFYETQTEVVSEFFESHAGSQLKQFHLEQLRNISNQLQQKMNVYLLDAERRLLGHVAELTELAQNISRQQGPPGPPGPVGPPGSKGRIGALGLPGIKGDKGDKGRRGTKGDEGQGIPGDHGLPGMKGTKGDTGSTGLPGKIGQRGSNGNKGDRGLPGLPGEHGADGAKGNKGSRGSQGLPGQIGPQGEKGEKGASGVMPGDRSSPEEPVDGNEEVESVSHYLEEDKEPPFKRSPGGDCELVAVKKFRKEAKQGVYHAAWMRDPVGSDNDKLWFAPRFLGNSLEEYNSMAAFKDHNVSALYKLPFHWDGMGHVVYNGSFYYHRGLRTVVRYDLKSQTVVASADIPSVAYRSSKYTYMSGYTFVDFEVDENGLWIIYSSPQSNGNIMVSKLDSQNLSVIKTITTGHLKQSAAEAIIVCGVLYTAKSNTKGATTFNYGLDLYSGKELPNVDIQFKNEYGRLTMLTYNTRDRKLYALDKGHLVTYTLEFRDDEAAGDKS